MENEKVKITVDVIKSLIELFDSESEDNEIIAFNMLNSLDWKVTNKTHIFYAELFWYHYLGSFRYKEDSCYRAERMFAFNVLRKMGCKWLIKSVDNFDDAYYLTKDLKRRVSRFIKKNKIPVLDGIDNILYSF